MGKKLPNILAYVSLFLGGFLSAWGYFIRQKCLNPGTVDAPGGFIAVSPADWICNLGEISLYLGIFVLLISPVLFHYSRNERFLYLEDMLLRPKRFYSTRASNQVNTWLVLGFINSIIFSILWTLSQDPLRYRNLEFLGFTGVFAEFLRSTLTMMILITVLASLTHLIVFIIGKRGFKKTFSPFFHSLIIIPFLGILFHIPETSILEDPTLLSIPLMIYYLYMIGRGVYINHFETPQE